MKGGAIVAVSAVVARGDEDDSKKDFGSSFTIPSWMSCVLCAAEVAVYSTPVLEERGDRQMRQKDRVLTLIGVLTSSAVE
jgi:hypothetical protein